MIREEAPIILHFLGQKAAKSVLSWMASWESPYRVLCIFFPADCENPVQTVQRATYSCSTRDLSSAAICSGSRSREKLTGAPVFT
jgi:hypothetical protein